MFLKEKKCVLLKLVIKLIILNKDMKRCSKPITEAKRIKALA